jgi:hypothetical protein
VARPSGPIEEYPWPQQLDGHVVTPGASPRLHGFEVESDLARHYRFGDVVLLALIGELPSDPQLEAFDAAMTFLVPLAISEGPTHVAALARLCGARSNGVLGAAAVALAERARAVVEAAAPVLEWLAAPMSPFPAERRADEGAEDHEAVQRLREALAARGVHVEALERPLSRNDALVVTLWFAGLRKREQMETALVIASLASVVAESLHHGVAAFRQYPMQLPRFEYEDP